MNQMTRIQPSQAIVLSFCFPSAFFALVADLAYLATYELQWKNFASWSVVGMTAFAFLSLVWAVIGLSLREEYRTRLTAIYGILILSTFMVGGFNILVHAKDGYAAMPMGAILSALACLLTLAASWIGFGGMDKKVTK